jgi:Linalool dehydratase/isomerase
MQKETGRTKLLGRLARGTVALLAATAIWIPSVHFFFKTNAGEFWRPKGLSPTAEQLAARHLQLWTDPKLRTRELGRMRESNAEWDFMGRTLFVWSLGEMGVRNPAAKQDYLKVMDQIIGETLQLEKERGMYFFLMPYARLGAYVMKPARSQFLDSEVAIMMEARQFVEKDPEYTPLIKELVDTMQRRMESGPVLSAESYPDECWAFDNTAALVAMRMEDRLDGTDHSAFIRRWIAMAKRELTDRNTGLLVSAYTVNGQATYGPEGSSIWMMAYFLRFADESFAQDQYQRAKREFSREMDGFAWSREWPASWRGEVDVDSGPIIPGFDISPGASGMAFAGAAAFQDDEYLSALATTLDFSGFPSREHGRLRYCASNQVGDATLLYATVLGPLLEKTEGK